VIERHSGIAERYATALLELAQEERAVSDVERDLETLMAGLRESADLRRFVQSPVFSRADHAKAMKALLARAGSSTLTTKFVLTLASKRRLYLLAEIIRAYRDALARIRGEVDAQVTSARALSESETAELKAAIKKSLGREPKLETRVDASLLGGLIVKIGSRMVDSSLRTKLQSMRLAMRGS